MFVNRQKKTERVLTRIFLLSYYLTTNPKRDYRFNPLSSMSDQERISPYDINTIQSIEVMRIK